MRNFSALPLLFMAISLAACNKDDSNAEAPFPPCLIPAIATFESVYACHSGATVNQYTFQGHLVYTLNPGMCGADMSSEVIDENCKTIGYLGGVTGNTEINGEEFGNAVFVKTVWAN